MKHAVIAVDLAKSVFEVAVSTTAGVVSERKRLGRKKFSEFMAQLQPAVVVMEACGTSYFWGRRFQELGHKVELLPPQHVRSYVIGNKTDRTDVKGLLEAHRNEDIHRVPVKSVEQQMISTLHRVRSGWVADRTARVNALRGHLREFGYSIQQGRWHVVPRVRELTGDADSRIPDGLREVFWVLCEEIDGLSEKIRNVELQLKALSKQLPEVKQLLSIPGVGLLTSTALFAFVGDVQRFPSGRHLASYLGLTPRERSSGAKRWLGGISKRGDAYLRTLLIHGARSVLYRARSKGPKSHLQEWALRVEHARGRNKATVALANKLARIVWALLKKGETFQIQPQAA